MRAVPAIAPAAMGNVCTRPEAARPTRRHRRTGRRHRIRHTQRRSTPQRSRANRRDESEFERSLLPPLGPGRRTAPSTSA
ncbi:MAG: hypothetical protein F6K09_06490, partial [Merismopedia sp. SIO2A8]|nr:hypothetical protein [Merismopedia sp. SIO2A8]